MMYRVALLVGVAGVAGFSSTPNAELGARSTFLPGDRDCSVQKVLLNGLLKLAPDAFCRLPAGRGGIGGGRCPLEDKNGVANKPVKCTMCEENSFVKCMGNGDVQPNLPRKNARKNCFVDGWCYFREGDYNSCEYFRRGCETPGSSDCQSYERLVESGKCKKPQEAGESLFCTQGIGSRSLTSSCNSLVTEAACAGGYTKTPATGRIGVKHGYSMLNFPDNGPRLSRDYATNDMYQACEWQGSYCTGATDSSKSYDAVSFCGQFCDEYSTVSKDGKQNLGTTKCNQGQLDQNPAQFPWGLPSRLGNMFACRNSFFEIGSSFGVVYQGCDWLGPLNARDYFSSDDRCKPRFYCSDTTISAGQCKPACNCMPKLGTACTPAQIMCCKNGQCNVCATAGMLVDAGTYAPATTDTTGFLITG